MSMHGKSALVTGITGQDGAYLTKLLLEKGYTVYGAFRRARTVNFWRFNELGVQEHPNLKLIKLDITDQSNCISLIKDINPNEIYDLAAQSFVKLSFEQPMTTAQITALDVLNLLELLELLILVFAFIKQALLKYLVKFRLLHKMSKYHFASKAPMAWLNFMLIGLH